MSRYPQGGYSWLCVPPLLGKRKLSVIEKKELKSECLQMEETALLLEETIHRYHLLCKRIDVSKNESLFQQLALLKVEIESLTKEVDRLLSLSYDLVEKDVTSK